MRSFPLFSVVSLLNYPPEDNNMTPMKAIRAHCIECCGGQWKEVRLCPAQNCALHPFRMGHRPKEESPHRGEEKTEEI